MGKKISKSLFVMLAVMILLTIIGLSTSFAATEGYYTYTVENGEATITDVDESISGKVTIPSKLGGYPVTSIGWRTFYCCTSLTSITIPDSVTSIGNDAFYNCTSLESITLSDSVTSIGWQTFYCCTSLTSITIPDTVTSIDDYAFYNCTSLTSITIPDSVTSIGNSAFSNCSALTSITILDSVTSIGDDAFYNTAYYNNHTNWSNGVLYIGKYLIEANSDKISGAYAIKKGTNVIAGSAFYYCSALTSMTIPDSVTSIGDDAFYNCASLESITLPDSVTSISDGVFEFCTSLTSITIPDSVTSIGDDAFSYCESLTNITLPNSVISIGDWAFSCCDSLTSITIPDSVTSIGNFAFSNCSALTSITLPDSVTNIGDAAFNNCTSLTSITVDKNNSYYSSDSYGVLFNKNKTELIQYPQGNGRTSYSIPNFVTSIGDSAFVDCTSLTSITIPDSVTSIGYNAFTYCTRLTSITLPDSVTSIGYGAFASCTSLTSITIPDLVTSIVSYAFEDCTSLTSITIPDSVTSIGNSAFYGCTSLKDVYYTGTEKQWKNIDISYENENLTNATIHYNYCDHKYTTTTTKATLSKSGSIKTACTVCGTVKTNKTISYPKTFTLSATSYTFNGNVKTPTVTVKDAAGKVLTKDTDYTVTYSSGRKNVGTYNVTVTMKGNYTGTKTLSFKINPMDISKCTVKLSATSYTYNAYVRTPTVTVTNSNGAKLTKDTHYTVTYASGRKNVGTYNVTVKLKGNYTGTKTLSFKIKPIDISKCTVKLSATSVIYNGKVRTPVVTVTNPSGVKLTKDAHYTVTYASGRKNVGTYNVTVKMFGNYTGTKILSFKINPINISTCTVKLSATSLTYNGNVRTPTVTVTNSYGTKLTKDKHYTVSYSTGRKNVGTYKVTVKMIGNYTGTKTLSFKITPMDISKCTVKLSATSVTYNGEVRTPTVSIVNPNGAKLTKDTHYTVTYSSGRKNVGTYKITVKLKGNYTGTKTLSFKILPPKTTISKLTAGAKKITVNLTKKTTQVTGYQIQYSTSKDFTNAKTKTLTSYSIVKTTLSSLTANKTYYVRVRTYKTVNDVKYYSGWSASKYVKTK